ncbi:hypothetical protein P3T43_006623 [Paraburkholderia sp. GAS41]
MGGQYSLSNSPRERPYDNMRGIEPGIPSGTA